MGHFDKLQAKKVVANNVDLSGTLKGDRREVVANGGTDVVLSSGQSGAVCLFDTAGASSFTLPAPSPGLNFTFITTVLATADHVIKVNTENTDGFLGGMIGASTTQAKSDAFSADADGSNDVITLGHSSAATGGGAGNMVYCCAIDTENWAVMGMIHGVGSTLATPFGDAQQ